MNVIIYTSGIFGTSDTKEWGIKYSNSNHDTKVIEKTIKKLLACSSLEEVEGLHRYVFKSDSLYLCIMNYKDEYERYNQFVIAVWPKSPEEEWTKQEKAVFSKKEKDYFSSSVNKIYFALKESAKDFNFDNTEFLEKLNSYSFRLINEKKLPKIEKALPQKTIKHHRGFIYFTITLFLGVMALLYYHEHLFLFKHKQYHNKKNGIWVSKADKNESVKPLVQGKDPLKENKDPKEISHNGKIEETNLKPLVQEKDPLKENKDPKEISHNGKIEETNFKPLAQEKDSLKERKDPKEVNKSDEIAKNGESKSKKPNHVFLAQLKPDLPENEYLNILPKAIKEDQQLAFAKLEKKLDFLDFTSNIEKFDNSIIFLQKIQKIIGSDQVIDKKIAETKTLSAEQLIRWCPDIDKLNKWRKRSKIWQGKDWEKLFEKASKEIVLKDIQTLNKESFDAFNKKAKKYDLKKIEVAEKLSDKIYEMLGQATEKEDYQKFKIYLENNEFLWNTAIVDKIKSERQKLKKMRIEKIVSPNCSNWLKNIESTLGYRYKEKDFLDEYQVVKSLRSNSAIIIRWICIYHRTIKNNKQAMSKISDNWIIPWLETHITKYKVPLKADYFLPRIQKVLKKKPSQFGETINYEDRMDLFDESYNFDDFFNSYWKKHFIYIVVCNSNKWKKATLGIYNYFIRDTPSEIKSLKSMKKAKKDVSILKRSEISMMESFNKFEIITDEFVKQYKLEKNKKHSQKSNEIPEKDESQERDKATEESKTQEDQGLGEKQDSHKDDNHD